jgi:hypothetical protein
MAADVPAQSEWSLKGAGQANLVYAYTGHDPKLVRLDRWVH